MEQYRQKPAAAPAPQNRQPEQPAAARKGTTAGKSKKWLVPVIIAALVLVIGAGIAYKLVLKKNNAGLVGVNTNQYQALFLTNGQVYFGKLKAADSKTVQIKDIYYLQVQQAVQPKEGEEQQGETQLVKLGQELHGPEDEMFIDRGQVLFWENLKNDGKVVTAIKEYQNK